MANLPDTVARIISEVNQIAESACLWPGWDVKSAPMALYGTENAYLIGHPSPPENYEILEPIAGRPVYGGPRLPEMVANTAWFVAGELCAMARIPDSPDPDNSTYARLVIHECFHVFQLKTLTKVARPNFMLSGKYPEGDAENNALSIVENRLLAAAIEDFDPKTAASFLAVRAFRHRLLESAGLSDICLYEQQSEFNEGAPTYVEARAGRPVGDIAEKLRQANIGGKWAAMQRFYYTGASIGLLLDQLMPRWHEALAEGAHTMQSLLMDAVCSPLPQVESVLEAWGYQDILAAEKIHEARRLKEISSMFDALQTGPGLMVQIEVPPKSMFVFDPSRVLGVDPNTKFHTRKFGIRTETGVQVDIEGLCLEEQEKHVQVGEPQAPDLAPDQSRRAHVITLRLPEPPKVTQAERFRLSGEGLSVDAPSAVIADTEKGCYIRFR